MMTPIDEARRAKFHDAVCRVVGWRSDVLERTMAALLTAALLQQDDGVGYFGADDLPEALRPKPDETHNGKSAKGITGVATHCLKKAGIIHRYFGTIPGEKILYGERTSKAADRNGAQIKLWTLKNRRDLAVKWLTDHHFQVPQPHTQKELIPA